MQDYAPIFSPQVMLIGFLTSMNAVLGIYIRLKSNKKYVALH